MLGQLDQVQIDDVLRSESIGRLACVADGWPYVVPITYVYDGEFVYGHSSEGLKLRATRAEPRVCFEVEQIRSPMNWRTVVLRGRFEQLWRDDEERVLNLLRTKFTGVETSETAMLHMQENAHRRAGIRRSALFRIRIEEVSGRFELL